MQVIHEQSSLDFVNAHNSDLQINQVVGFSLKKVNPQSRCLQFRSENMGDIYRSCIGNRELKARPKLKQNSGNFHARASQVCLAVDTRAELFSLLKLCIHLHDPPCFVTLSIHISYPSANLGKEAL